MSKSVALKNFILTWLSVIWSLFLAALIILSAVMLSMGNDMEHLPRTLVGVLFAATFVFVLADFLIFQINRRFSIVKSNYYPNLKVWGIGILTGAGGAIMYFFCVAALKLMKIKLDSGEATGNIRPSSFILLAIFNEHPEGESTGKPEIIVFLTLALLLLLIILSIVKISIRD